MILRSGKSINGVSNSQIRKDLNDIQKWNNAGNTPQYGYCKTCFTIFTMFGFLEKYHKNIRGEERTIHGSQSEWFSLYANVREKLEEFIKIIEQDHCECKCVEEDRYLGGAIYRNIHRMDELSARDNYAEMADYTGYGKEREKYRIYHRNFFILEEVEDEDGSILCYMLTRDFEKTRSELLHWLEYFKQEHQTVLDAAEKALLSKSIGKDSVGEIMKFL